MHVLNYHRSQSVRHMALYICYVTEQKGEKCRISYIRTANIHHLSTVYFSFSISSSPPSVEHSHMETSVMIFSTTEENDTISTFFHRRARSVRSSGSLSSSSSFKQESHIIKQCSVVTEHTLYLHGEIERQTLTGTYEYIRGELLKGLQTLFLSLK